MSSQTLVQPDIDAFDAQPQSDDWATADRGPGETRAALALLPTIPVALSVPAGVALPALVTTGRLPAGSGLRGD